jgi:hypothetical protein
MEAKKRKKEREGKCGRERKEAAKPENQRLGSRVSVTSPIQSHCTIETPLHNSTPMQRTIAKEGAAAG